MFSAQVAGSKKRARTTSVQTSAAVLARQMVKSNLLPWDSGVTVDKLNRLFLRPNAGVSSVAASTKNNTNSNNNNNNNNNNNSFGDGDFHDIDNDEDIMFDDGPDFDDNNNAAGPADASFEIQEVSRSRRKGDHGWGVRSGGCSSPFPVPASMSMSMSMFIFSLTHS